MLRLVSFACPGEVRLGALVRDFVVDLSRADPAVPSSMYGLLIAGEAALDHARTAAQKVAAEYETNGADLIHRGVVYPLAEVRVLAPLPRPRRNLFCIGWNYYSHTSAGAPASETLAAQAKECEYPIIFTKPPTAVIGQDGIFPLDEALTQKLDYEVEMAVILGRGGRNIPREDAQAHVFGYTVANDISARDVQNRHIQWFKGKGLDNSCPLGPVVVPHGDIGDPQSLPIRLSVNGQIRQDANTRDMAWPVPDLIYWLSQGMTLEPGDIILTGTPAGVGARMNPPGWLRVGDVVEAEIEPIGRLRTYVVRG